MQYQGIELSRLGEGLGSDGGGGYSTVLVDVEVDGSGIDRLERESNVDDAGFIIYNIVNQCDNF